MESLTVGQFDLVYNMFSLTVAAMGASALFFFFSQQQVAPKYRVALTVSGIVVSVACYHYFRIFDSWHAAYAYDAATSLYKPVEGVFFNRAYRYADWIITVPLLMVELVAVLALATAESRALLKKLTVAAFLMIALGYPGEVATATGPKIGWFIASFIPFVYILSVLWGELGRSLANQPQSVKEMVSGARWITLITWSFYPIAFLAPLAGLGAATGIVALEVGYTIADITAKCGFGLYIYGIARAKTLEETGLDLTKATAA
jgi:bacteriorhodopsin